jgi:hypothetical protein
MGEPTKENIVDYVQQMIEKIPQKQRNQQGWEIQLSYDLLNWYKDRAGEMYVLQYVSDQGKSKYNGLSPLNYPNYKFQPLIDQTNTLFIGIVKSKNVEDLQYMENEKGEFTLTREKRDTNLFADFKEGIRFVQVGRQLEAGDPKEFEYQVVFSNNCPIFPSDVRVPLFDRGSSVVALKFPEFYPHFEIVENSYGQDITNITGLVPGQIVTVTGLTTLSADRKVKNNTNLLLGEDFQLNTGGTLTLIVQADGKLKKLYATAGPASAPEMDKTFNTAVVDVKGGTIFKATTTENLTISNLINGVDGKLVTIYGTNASGVAVTIATITGVIEVASDANLLSKDDYIQLTRVNGVWYEVKRLIA